MDKEKTLKRINDYWTGSHKCMICGSDDWILLEKVWELPWFQGEITTFPRPILPVVALMCNVCGHTIFFNAIAVEAIKKD